jgi:hypothetical protein
MNDPMSRKLFQSREAREQLRGMGGIMASSPRLAETVAKFNDGGMISEFSGLPPEMTGVTVPVVGAAPRVSARSTLTPQQEAVLLELGITPEMAARMSPEEIDAIVNFEDITAPRREAFAEVIPPFEDAAPSNVETFVAETFMPGRAAEMRARDSAAGREPPAVVEERRTAEEERDVEEQVAEAVEESAAPPVQEDLEPPPGPGTGTAALTDVEGTGAAIGRGDFDTTYDQMLSRLQNVMGTEDKDSREKAMANLAMIGLAIAAGQSPNALTNIAQGALVGMRGVQEAEAAETARERELRLEAMRLAASDVDLRRRLESSERIAAMRGAGGGTYSPERLYQQNLGAILSNPDMFDVFTDNAVDPAKATALAESLSQRGMSLGTGGGDAQFTPGQLVVQDGVTYEYQQDGSWKRAGE